MKHFLGNKLLTTFATAFSALAKSSVLVAILSICAFVQPAYAATAEQLAEVRNHINRGNMLLGRRLFQDAIGEYENALKIDPANQIAKDNIALTHNNWGIHFWGAHKFNEAKEQWEQALKLNPNDGHARRNLKILEQHMRQQPPVANQAGEAHEADGPEKPKPKPNPDGKTAANANVNSNTDNGASDSTPPAVPSPGQQEARMDTTSVIKNPESGALLIINSSTNYDQPAVESAAQANPAPENTTIRIIGGSSSTASIVGTGSSLSANPPNPPAQSNPVTPPVPASSFNIVAPNTGATSYSYGGGTSGSVNTVGGGAPANAASTYAPVEPPASSSYTNTAPGQSVPLSWPSRESSRESQAASSAPETPPSFTRSRPSTKQNNATNPVEQAPDQEQDSDAGANSATFDNKVAKIETTVYGKPAKNVPILRRIEKLEMDTFGKKKTGAIADRIKDLNQAYGI